MESQAAPEPQSSSAAPRGAGVAPVLLAASGVSKRFGPVRALDRVDFGLRAGEIRALMGENGAGKSTLIKCMTGVYAPDAGEVRYQGRAASVGSPREAEALGVSTVYQEVNLIPHMTVAENICLGREPRRRWLGGCIRWRRVREKADAALGRLGVDVDPGREVASCSIAVQQLVAIARALDVNARVLILDEPTSSLDRDEVARLFGVMRHLRSQGLGIVFVTHFLEQVYAVSDSVTVLRDGTLVGTLPIAEVPRRRLVGMMVGREVEDHRPSADANAPGGPPRAEILRAEGLAKRGMLESVSLRVEAGETVGLAGLLGSGRTETARLLFGAARCDGGRLRIAGRDVRLRSPRAAIAHGIALTPENRRTEGVVPHLSVRENIALAVQARRGLRATLSGEESRRLAERYVAMLRIKTSSIETPVGQLSGGNQQKVLLARWLATEPRLLMLDEPTRGIDVAAKSEILRTIDELRQRGMSILFISSELEEVVRVCSRVVVLRDRRSIAELEGGELSEAAILNAIAEHQPANGRPGGGDA
ncbi:MAG: sugar ABC transporter ATP-binding protein [Phycisphaerales bacterium]|nr:sugar ABC transporter ATP-binding protein [Phycisphaerales bacterium]